MFPLVANALLPHERIEEHPILVIKKDGVREAFSRNKIPGERGKEEIGKIRVVCDQYY